MGCVPVPGEVFELVSGSLGWLGQVADGQGTPCRYMGLIIVKERNEVAGKGQLIN